MRSVTFAQETESGLFAKSVQAYQLGHYQESQKILLALVHTYPKKSVYWFNLGNGAFMLGDFEQALRYFDKVIVMNSSFVSSAQLYRIKTLRHLGLNDRAESELNKLQTLSNQGKGTSILNTQLQNEQDLLDEISFQESLALDFYQQDDFAKAEATLESVREHGLSMDGRLLLGMTLMRQNKNIEAEKEFFLLANGHLTPLSQKETATDLLKQLRHSKSITNPLWLNLKMKVEIVKA